MHHGVKELYYPSVLYCWCCLVCFFFLPRCMGHAAVVLAPPNSWQASEQARRLKAQGSLERSNQTLNEELCMMCESPCFFFPAGKPPVSFLNPAGPPPQNPKMLHLVNATKAYVVYDPIGRGSKAASVCLILRHLIPIRCVR